MVKSLPKNIISPFSIIKDKIYYSLYKKNKGGSKIYRCNYCHTSRIKLEGELFYKLSGHKKHCPIFTKKFKYKNNIKNKISKQAKELMNHKNKKNKFKKFKLEDKITLKKEGLNNNLNDNLFIQNKDEVINLSNYIFSTKKIIGTGSFINTYIGYNMENNREVAVKINKEKKKLTTSVIEIEVLKKTKGIIGFPEIQYFQKYKRYDIVIQDLLGPSLKKLINFYGGPFDINTIGLIGIEIITRIKALHSLGILHNDLKPSNFSWGIFINNNIEYRKTIFMIDFGLCTLYKKLIKDNLIYLDEENNDNKSFISDHHYKRYGNLEYMSIDVLNGKRATRKTEMESFIYIIIFLFKLKLPWSSVKSKSYLDRLNKIRQIHYITKLDKLCEGIPYQILFILNHIRNLPYDERPNYELYEKVLKDLIKLDISKEEKIFCWEKKLSKCYKLKKNNNNNSKLLNEYNELFNGYYIE